MAKREKGGYRDPNEREAEGLRQLIALTQQMQQLIEERDPEGFARMMIQVQQQQKSRGE
jgi:hypothetical protein